MKKRTIYTDKIVVVTMPSLPAEQLYRWLIDTNTYLYSGVGSVVDAQHEATINKCSRVCIHRC